jgi:hypothetical protein
MFHYISIIKNQLNNHSFTLNNYFIELIRGTTKKIFVKNYLRITFLIQSELFHRLKSFNYIYLGHKNILIDFT